MTPQINHPHSCVLKNADFESTWIARPDLRPPYTRKDWEESIIAASCRGGFGLGFGVGRERLPSLFAARNCFVLATDQRAEAPNAVEYWGKTGQLARIASDLHRPEIVSSREFEGRVAFQTRDMNDLHRVGNDYYDFVWSCGSLEHLGSLEKSMDFILNSLDCLLPNGQALHTTEFNLEWNNADVREGPNVFFRKQDVLDLESRLNKKGYTLMPCDFETDLTWSQVDYAPYRNECHRVLESTGVITTSLFLNIHEKT